MWRWLQWTDDGDRDGDGVEMGDRDGDGNEDGDGDDSFVSD